MKAGKKVGTSIYVQASAIEGGRSILSSKQIQKYLEAKKHIEGFEYDLVCFGTFYIRFMKMNSLEVPHPYVVDALKVDLLNNMRVSNGKLNKQIYHRLDAILDPMDKNYEFHKKVTEHEERIGALGPFKIHGKSASGHAHIWLLQLKDLGVEYDPKI